MCTEYVNTINMLVSSGEIPEYVEIGIKEGKIKGFKIGLDNLWFCLNDLGRAFGVKEGQLDKFRARADKTNTKTLKQLRSESPPVKGGLDLNMPRSDSLFVDEAEMWLLMMNGQTEICLELQDFLKKYVMPQVLRTGTYFPNVEQVKENKWVEYSHNMTLKERSQLNRSIRLGNNGR